MNYEEILQTVRGFCAREKLLDGKKHLALAVSGGADSMALLCLIRPLAGEKGIALTVCHVNHGLRGETADRDEAFVREVCARLGLPLRVFHAAELEAEAGKPRAGEDWARRLRYACFERVLADGIDAVATAHTGSDQAETLLFRLARGTGLHGAAGIRPSRPGYLRPLLCLTRADTEAVCRACGERWVTDETNDADDYARNRLRHGALPALCGVNSAAERNLARFCEKAAKADEYFARQADALLASARAADAKSLPGGAGYALRSGQPVWMSEPLRQTDPLILDMALHSLVEPVRDAEEKYIRLLADLVEKGSGAVQLTDAVRFCARDGVLWRYRATPLTAPDIALLSSVRDIIEIYLSPIAIIGLMLAISGVIGAIMLLWLRAKKYKTDYYFGAAQIILFGGVLIAATLALLKSGTIASQFPNLPDAYHDNGFAYCFSASAITQGISEPADYSEDEINSILEAEGEIPASRKNGPNI